MRDVEEIKCFADEIDMRILNMHTSRNYMLNDITLKNFQADGRLRWEAILGGYDSTVKYYSENNKVKIKISQTKIVTVESIKEYLEWRYGEGNYNVEYDADNFILNVTVNAVTMQTSGLYERIREYVPCNIIVNVERIDP